MYSEGKSAPIEQKRKVVTAIPGPKSAELIKRRADVVSASLGMAFPVFIERSQGGIIVDVDGNQTEVVQATRRPLVGFVGVGLGRSAYVGL